MKAGDVLNEVLRRAKEKGVDIDTDYLHACYNEAIAYISILATDDLRRLKTMNISSTPVALPQDFCVEKMALVGDNVAKIFTPMVAVNLLVWYNEPWVYIRDNEVVGDDTGVLFYSPLRDFYVDDDTEVDLPDEYLPMFVDLVTALYLLRASASVTNMAQFYMERALASVIGGG